MCKLQMKDMKENELKSDFKISKYKLFKLFKNIVNIDISNYGEYGYG